MFAAPVDTTGAAFHVGPGKRLWEHAYAGFGGFAGPRSYDLPADGTQFLVLKDLGTAAALDQRTMVVENWFEELKTPRADALSPDTRLDAAPSQR